jgi:hypothetical protein
MCYSLQSGLEGILWYAKNEARYAWLRLPLASLLCEFLKAHRSCIENYYGGSFDLSIAMPSHPSTRGGLGHLEAIINSVQGFSREWTTGALVKNDASKAGTRRGEIVPDLFSASPAVRGKRVLLFDDTYTTGGSIASAAHALKQAGAATVVGLAFGRQLSAEWHDSREFVASLSGRTLEIAECAVHGERPVNPFDFLFSQPG